VNSFFKKVEVERTVIQEVNMVTYGDKQLSGLSWAAINNWCAVNTISQQSDLIYHLKSLSDLCNSLSDRSNENFLSVPIDRVERIKLELGLLKSELSNFHKSS